MSAPPDPSSAVKRALVGALLLLAVMALTLFALSRSLPEAARLQELAARTEPLPLLGAMGVMTGGMFFMALRWRSLIPGGGHLPATGLTAIVCAGLLLNYALPGPVGELAVAFLVSRRYGVEVSPALAAGIHSRFVGLGVAGALAGAVWLLGDMPVPPDYQGLIGFTAIGIATGATGLGVLSARPKLLRAISARTAGWAGARLGGRVGAGLGKLDEAVSSVAESMGQVGRLGAKAYGMAVLWAMCGHLSVATGIWMGASAMGLTPYPPGVMFTYCAATAGVVALFAVPGGQLGWDAMFWSFFSVTTGVEVADALAVTVLVRAQQVLLLVFGGGALAFFGPGVAQRAAQGDPRVSEPSRR